jgi:ATP-dependent exoDNAse (exonuclease V) alpha subunit
MLSGAYMTQNDALDILETGANVFLTGAPGSGKTHTIHRYIEWLRDEGVAVGVTASTGIAATHLGGFTIHSWSGVGIRDRLTNRDLKTIAANDILRERVSKARVLVIDEISMLSGPVLTAVNQACRSLRDSPMPFGGLQVVLVGDFFQLPPVYKRSTGGLFAGQEDAGPSWAFDAGTWRDLDPRICYLTEQHRQQDLEYLDILSAIRTESVHDGHRERLASRRARIAPSSTTKLYSHNADVDRQNLRALSGLPGPLHTFEMESEGPDPLIRSLVRGCMSPEMLQLKTGARVMFTRNDFMAGYVNGTTGVVAGFSDDAGGYPIVETDAGDLIDTSPAEWRVETPENESGTIRQIPLRLAWAITVHKSQGMSLDSAYMDLSRTFEYGQGYVALSRVRSLEGLSLGGINDRALRVHPRIVERDAEFRERSREAESWLRASASEKIGRMKRSFLDSS